MKTSFVLNASHMAHLKRQPLPEQEGRASPHPVTAQLARVGGSVGQGCPFPLAYVLYVQMSKTPMHVFLALKQTNQALQRTTLSPPSFVVSVILWRLCLTSDKLVKVCRLGPLPLPVCLGAFHIFLDLPVPFVVLSIAQAELIALVLDEVPPVLLGHKFIHNTLRFKVALQLIHGHIFDELVPRPAAD
mmetsp:Transcript_11215/g.29238  ORF Transcript_11215/g.29238 Transcript_11215/m.29238 type:complete len:188 (+) Transcript_11215:638-1201(+)